MSYWVGVGEKTVHMHYNAVEYMVAMVVMQHYHTQSTGLI